MKYTNHEVAKARKTTKIYNTLGFLNMLCIIIFAILWIWMPIFGKIFASFVVMFIGLLMLYFGTGASNINDYYDKNKDSYHDN